MARYYFCFHIIFLQGLLDPNEKHPDKDSNGRTIPPLKR